MYFQAVLCATVNLKSVSMDYQNNRVLLSTQLYNLGNKLITPRHKNNGNACVYLKRRVV